MPSLFGMTGKEVWRDVGERMERKNKETNNTRDNNEHIFILLALYMYVQSEKKSHARTLEEPRSGELCPRRCGCSGCVAARSLSATDARGRESRSAAALVKRRPGV
jgi:hypothetical protein